MSTSNLQWNENSVAFFIPEGENCNYHTNVEVASPPSSDIIFQLYPTRPVYEISLIPGIYRISSTLSSSALPPSPPQYNHPFMGLFYNIGEDCTDPNVACGTLVASSANVTITDYPVTVYLRLAVPSNSYADSFRSVLINQLSTSTIAEDSNLCYIRRPVINNICQNSRMLPSTVAPTGFTGNYANSLPSTHHLYNVDKRRECMNRCKSAFDSVDGYAQTSFMYQDTGKCFCGSQQSSNNIYCDMTTTNDAELYDIISCELTDDHYDQLTTYDQVTNSYFINNAYPIQNAFDQDPTTLFSTMIDAQEKYLSWRVSGKVNMISVINRRDTYECHAYPLYIYLGTYPYDTSYLCAVHIPSECSSSFYTSGASIASSVEYIPCTSENPSYQYVTLDLNETLAASTMMTFMQVKAYTLSNDRGRRLEHDKTLSNRRKLESDKVEMFEKNVTHRRLYALPPTPCPSDFDPCLHMPVRFRNFGNSMCCPSACAAWNSAYSDCLGCVPYMERSCYRDPGNACNQPGSWCCHDIGQRDGPSFSVDALNTYYNRAVNENVCDDTPRAPPSFPSPLPPPLPPINGNGYGSRVSSSGVFSVNIDTPGNYTFCLQTNNEIQSYPYARAIVYRDLYTFCQARSVSGSYCISESPLPSAPPSPVHNPPISLIPPPPLPPITDLQLFYNLAQQFPEAPSAADNVNFGFTGYNGATCRLQPSTQWVTYLWNHMVDNNLGTLTMTQTNDDCLLWFRIPQNKRLTYFQIYPYHLQTHPQFHVYLSVCTDISQCNHKYIGTVNRLCNNPTGNSFSYVIPNVEPDYFPYIVIHKSTCGSNIADTFILSEVKVFVEDIPPSPLPPPPLSIPSPPIPRYCFSVQDPSFNLQFPCRLFTREMCLTYDLTACPETCCCQFGICDEYNHIPIVGSLWTSFLNSGRNAICLDNSTCPPSNPPPNPPPSPPPPPPPSLSQTCSHCSVFDNNDNKRIPLGDSCHVNQNNDCVYTYDPLKVRCESVCLSLGNTDMYCSSVCNAGLWFHFLRCDPNAPPPNNDWYSMISNVDTCGTLINTYYNSNSNLNEAKFITSFLYPEDCQACATSDSVSGIPVTSTIIVSDFSCFNSDTSVCTPISYSPPPPFPPVAGLSLQGRFEPEFYWLCSSFSTLIVNGYLQIPSTYNGYNVYVVRFPAVVPNEFVGYENSCWIGLGLTNSINSINWFRNSSNHIITFSGSACSGVNAFCVLGVCSSYIFPTNQAYTFCGEVSPPPPFPPGISLVSGLLGSGCSYMHQSSTVDILERERNCQSNCDNNAGCLRGCELYKDSYINNQYQCYRYQPFANSSVFGEALLFTTERSQPEFCCITCRGSDRCVAFKFIRQNLQTFSSIGPRSPEGTGTCYYYESYQTIVPSILQESETVYVYDRQNQPPSPPFPPFSPPPPVCPEYYEIYDQVINDTACFPFGANINNQPLVECCNYCSNLEDCSGFNYNRASFGTVCEFKTCASSSLLTSVVSGSKIFTKILYPKPPPMPPDSPPSPSPYIPPISPLPPPPPAFTRFPFFPPPPVPESIPNLIFRPEILIPIIIGGVVVIILVIVLFVFCNEERSQAVTSVINSIRGKNNDRLNQNITINVQQLPYDAQNVNVNNENNTNEKKDKKNEKKIEDDDDDDE